MFALLHPSKTSVYETRLMGICVVNKSGIAVLAGPKKYEIPPASWIASISIYQRRQALPEVWMCRVQLGKTQKLRLLCVTLSSQHTSLNYSASLAGSRGSCTSIFFNPSAVLSLVGFVPQQCQGWASDYPKPELVTIFSYYQSNLSFSCC